MSWLVHLDVEPDEVEVVSSRLWSLGTTGIAELPDNKIVAGFDSQTEADQAVSAFGRGQVSVYDPSTIPSGQPSEVSFGNQTILLPNTDAFGHGAHATTALVLDAVHRHAKPGMRVLDMGCGTGVLAIAASLAGAHAVAVDNEPAALNATGLNAAANGIDLDVASSLEASAGPFDLVVANMLLADLRGVADQLLGAVSETGVIATTGFLTDQVEEVVALFAPLTVRHRESTGDWVLLELDQLA